MKQTTKGIKEPRLSIKERTTEDLERLLDRAAEKGKERAVQAIVRELNKRERYEIA